MNTPTNIRDGKTPHDEPEITQEEAVPNDGRDVEGEAMMKEVGNKKLQEPGDREHKTPEKAAATPDAQQPDGSR
ncbi:hypothetical protein [Variovorax ginsengisoli]|uniref:MARCKS-like protein n=1 Tax=Variovorax ginsengisoli TaxID=363844 RepID=A0ABT9SF54_9BURK|nr:hypothetical protein [Variovorax ginsengisoli]MDP9902524.1 hypothetical protein [Variovorax ginsengisoli]